MELLVIPECPDHNEARDAFGMNICWHRLRGPICHTCRWGGKPMEALMAPGYVAGEGGPWKRVFTDRDMEQIKQFEQVQVFRIYCGNHNNLKPVKV